MSEVTISEMTAWKDVEGQSERKDRSGSWASSSRASIATLVDLPTLNVSPEEEKKGSESILIAWDPLDPKHPFNWSTARKTSILMAGTMVTLLAAINATHMSIVSPIASKYFGVSQDTYLLGFTLYMIGIAISPLFLAPLSELYGRNALFQISSVVVMLLCIPEALSKNFTGYLITRLFQGMAASSGASLVSGSVSDMYRPKDRGTGMNIFTLLNFAGQAFGSIIFGWVTPRVGIPWTYGIIGFIALFACILNALFFRETRADVLLARRARELSRETGIKHVIALEENKPDIRQLLTTSLFRPIEFLFTEPIVTVISLWVGFAWGCVFLGGTSVTLSFEQYGWSLGQLGTVQASVLIGASLGFLSNYHQQYLYAKQAKAHGGRAPPEARLIWAAYGGLLFPLGLLVFSWTARPSIHWIVPMIFLCLSYWGIACIFSAILNYLADAYETLSSSAQAAQSLARNLIASILPLFARRLYKGMGYPQAGTLVASVALVMSVVPFLLIRYGAHLREKSKVARTMHAAC